MVGIRFWGSDLVEGGGGEGGGGVGSGGGGGWGATHTHTLVLSPGEKAAETRRRAK